MKVPVSFQDNWGEPLDLWFRHAFQSLALKVGIEKRKKRNCTFAMEKFLIIIYLHVIKSNQQWAQQFLAPFFCEANNTPPTCFTQHSTTWSIQNEVIVDPYPFSVEHNDKATFQSATAWTIQGVPQLTHLSIEDESLSHPLLTSSDSSHN